MPEATCYPRPLQEHVPILVGGSGERRTLRLVARYADACNLFGDARRRSPARSPCCTSTAPPSTATRRRSPSPRCRRRRSSAARPGATERYDACVGTVEEQIGRYRQYAEVGVSEAIVALHVDGTPAQIEAFAPVIAAFSTRSGQDPLRHSSATRSRGRDAVRVLDVSLSQ